MRMEASLGSREGQIINPISEIDRFSRQAYHFEVADHLAHRHAPLGREHNPSKWNPAHLSTRSFGQEVLILRNQNSTKACGPVKQVWVVQRGRAVLLGA